MSIFNPMCSKTKTDSRLALDWKSSAKLRAWRTVIALGFIGFVGGAVANPIHCSLAGFFDPDGTSAKPYGTISGALRHAGPGGTVTLDSPWYPGPLTLDVPGTITATTGPVTLGAPFSDFGSSRVVNVVCYNTHLFGSQLLDVLPYWRDGDYSPSTENPGRASMFGDFFADEAKHQISGGIDIIAADEVWSGPEDANLAEDVHEHYTSGVTNGYFYGSGRVSGGAQSYFLNSGLLLMSKHGVLSGSQEIFPYSTAWGVDALAAKSVVMGEVTIDGITIGVFVTHLQAEIDEDDDDDDGVENDSEGRRDQAKIVRERVRIYQQQNPSNPVIVMGDFNIIGDDYASSAEFTWFREMYGSINVHDSARNLHPLSEIAGFDTYVTEENNLAYEFQEKGTHLSERLDFILYGSSYDTQHLLVPVKHERLEWKFPDGPYTNPMWTGGFLSSSTSVTSSHLSDHFGLYSQFNLVKLY